MEIVYFGGMLFLSSLYAKVDVLCQILIYWSELVVEVGWGQNRDSDFFIYYNAKLSMLEGIHFLQFGANCVLRESFVGFIF